MQEYRIICKSDRGFINAVLAASQEDTMLDIDEANRQLIIPEFEAYRTGIPEIRKTLRANDVMLRSQYFRYSDTEYTVKKDISIMSTGTSGNLKKIDTHRNGAYLNAYVSTCNGHDVVYLYNDYRIVFLGNDRVPTLRYKPTYTKERPIDLGIKDFIEVCRGQTYLFGSSSDRLEELKVLYKLLPKLIKYSP